MGWFYYTGEAPAAVPVGSGEVVAVRPYTKIFIDPSAEGDIAVKRLLNMGRLCVTSWPKGQKPMKTQIDLAEKPKMGSTRFAEAIVESPSMGVDVAKVEKSSVEQEVDSGQSKRRASLKKKAEAVAAKSKKETTSRSNKRGTSNKANTEKDA